MKYFVSFIFITLSFTSFILSFDLTGILLDFGRMNFGTLDIEHGRVFISFGDVFLPSIPSLPIPPVFGVLFRFNDTALFKGFDEQNDITGFSLDINDLVFSGYSLRSSEDSRMYERGFGLMLKPKVHIMDISSVYASIGFVEKQGSTKETIESSNGFDMRWDVFVKTKNLSLNVSNDSYTLKIYLNNFPLSFVLERNTVETLWRINDDHSMKFKLGYSFGKNLKFDLSSSILGKFDVMGYRFNYLVNLKKDDMRFSLKSKYFDLMLNNMKPSLTLKCNLNWLNASLKMRVNGKCISIVSATDFYFKFDDFIVKPTIKLEDGDLSFTLNFSFEW